MAPKAAKWQSGTPFLAPAPKTTSAAPTRSGVEIPKGSAAGSWKPTLVCSDVLQNRDVFGSARLQDLGFTAVLHVEDSVDDSRAPVLTALDLSAETADVGLAAAPVRIQLKVTDGLSSLDGCIAILHGPSRPVALPLCGHRDDELPGGKQAVHVRLQRGDSPRV